MCIIHVHYNTHHQASLYPDNDEAAARRQGTAELQTEVGEYICFYEFDASVQMGEYICFYELDTVSSVQVEGTVLGGGVHFLKNTLKTSYRHALTADNDTELQCSLWGGYLHTIRPLHRRGGGGKCSGYGGWAAGGGGAHTH